MTELIPVAPIVSINLLLWVEHPSNVQRDDVVGSQQGSLVDLVSLGEVRGSDPNGNHKRLDASHKQSGRDQSRPRKLMLGLPYPTRRKQMATHCVFVV